MRSKQNESSWPLWKINERWASAALDIQEPVMADYRIDCINKPNRESRHEHITHVGGPKPEGGSRWRDTVPNIVRMIEDKVHRFYTSEGGDTAWVGVRTNASGNKYLQTYADGVWKDNLLALKECS